MGSDVKSEKSTFVTLKGLDACRTLVEQLTEEAKQALSVFGAEADALCWLADSLSQRES